MSATKGGGGSSNAGIGSTGNSRPPASAAGRSGWNSTPSGGSLLGDDDGLFGPSSHNPSRPDYGGLSDYADVFGGPPRYSNQIPNPNPKPTPGRAPPPPPSSASPLDSLFPGSKESPTRASSLPVYDKPVYDDDIFDGVPGMKSTASVRFDDVFASMSSAPNAPSDASHYDDLLGNLGRAEPESKGSRGKRSGGAEREDDLLGNFGRAEPESRSSRGKREDDLLGTFGRAEPESRSSRGKRSGGTEPEVTGFEDLIPGFGGSSPPPSR